MSQRPGRPMLILFQQITPATVKKALNESADATSGGGARDLRLRPYESVRPFMERLLPRTRTERRADAEITIRCGIATWGDGSEEKEIEYWPPTDARPGEGRITRISSLPPLANPPSDLEGAVVLFVQDESGLIWVRYSAAEGLRGSMPQVSDVIQGCIEQAGPGKIATGCIDLHPGGLGSWCNYDIPEADA